MSLIQKTAKALFICALGVFLFSLFEKKDVQRHSFLPRGEFVQQRPVEFLQRSLSNLQHEQQVSIEIENDFPSDLKSISFWVATWGQRVPFSQATLKLSSPACETSISPGQIEDNSYLTFQLPEDCKPVSPLKAKLTIVTQSAIKIAMWCKDLTGDWLPTSSLKAKVISAEGKYLGYALGNYLKRKSTQTTRLEVILGTWDLKYSSIAIIAAIFSLLTIVIFRSHSSATDSNKWVIKTCSAFAALGILWCVIIPPFQAPDEPDHMMSFLDLTKTQESLGSSLLTFAQRTHFERIKFNEAETIARNDLNYPAPAPWAGHIWGPDYNERSPLLAFFAKHLSWLGIEKLESEKVVLSLRMSNLILILASLMVCMKFMKSSLSPMTYLLAPPLFFFGMHISNYPISMAALFPAVLAGALALIERDKLSIYRSFIVIPLTAVIAFYLNKTTAQLLPFYVFVMAVGLGTLITGRLPWLRESIKQKTRILALTTLAVLCTIAIAIGVKFTPLPSVEQPPYLLIPMKQAIKASLIFISNTFGFGNEYSITHTFWNGLGWLDVRSTEVIAFFNRFFWLSLMATSAFFMLRRNRPTQASQLLMSILGFAVCVGFLSYSLQTKASINLSGRYLLPTYIGFFVMILVSLQPTLNGFSNESRAALKNTLLFLGCAFNLFYLSAALVRYYS